jgi:hypothetical protein
MAEAAQVLVIDDGSSLRRFQVPDLDRHQGWLLPRFKAAYPQVTDRERAGWLRGIIYQNEYLFLFQDSCVALFQVMRGHTLAPQAVIMEHFVWCEDKDNAEHQAQAANFYSEVQTWAKHQGAGTIIVEINSDVPHDMIKERLGRLFTRQEIFARLNAG